MKTGIELIAEERQHQIDKGRTAAYDALSNDDNQLVFAAQRLSLDDNTIAFIKKRMVDGFQTPTGWDENAWNSLISRPYKERLIICAALFAAEIDRLNYIENEKSVEVSTTD